MYATSQAIQDRYPARDLAQLTDPNGVVLDEGRLEQALTDASAEIDGYLQGRYSLPLAEVPAVLELLACDIAMYRLQALRPMGDIEDARKRYEDAKAYLRQVSRGEVQLGLSANDVPAQEGSGPEVISAVRTFGRGAMKGF